MAAEPSKERRYPRRSDISRAIAVARENGIEVGQLEIGPDGRIRIGPAASPKKFPDDEFDRWDRDGRL